MRRIAGKLLTEMWLLRYLEIRKRVRVGAPPLDIFSEFDLLGVKEKRLITDIL
jgi:hypothetical protein